MELYDLVKSKGSIDTYDTTYDAGVTVDFIADTDVKDNYDRFVNFLLHNVEVIDDKNDICEWRGFIDENMSVFKSFTQKNWVCTYEDDMNEFFYQWINEFNSYCAGYTSEDMYKELADNLEHFKEEQEKTQKNTSASKNKNTDFVR